MDEFSKNLFRVLNGQSYEEAITINDLTELEAEGHLAKLGAFSVNGQPQIVQLYLRLGDPQRLLDAATTIKKQLNERPRSQLEEPLRPKGKK